MSELGEYSIAVPLFAQAAEVFHRLTDTDLKNIRALGDLARVQDDEASCFEYAADPALAAVSGDRHRNLQAAAQLLNQEATTIRQIMKQDTVHEYWEPELAGVLIRLGSIQQTLHQSGDLEAMSRESLAVVKRSAAKEQASLNNTTWPLQRSSTSNLRRLESQSLPSTWPSAGCSLRIAGAPLRFWNWRRHIAQMVNPSRPSLQQKKG